jgi:hypothetical protein
MPYRGDKAAKMKVFPVPLYPVHLDKTAKCIYFGLFEPTLKSLAENWRCDHCHIFLYPINCLVSN